MFLLKRATTLVLLVTLFGILLPGVYIQPAGAQTEEAQAEGEVPAGFPVKAQSGDQPADANGFSGLRCFYCNHCEDNKDLGCTQRCRPGKDYCMFGQVEKRGGYGFKSPFRGCASLDFVQKYSCGELPDDFNSFDEKTRVCACQTDLCNNQDADTLPSSSTQLLPFRILVAVSVFGWLMMM